MKTLYNGTSAYNLDEYDNYARTSEENRKKRVSQRRKESVSMCRFLIVTVIAVFCIASALVYANVMMIRASTETEKLKDKLAREQKEIGLPYGAGVVVGEKSKAGEAAAALAVLGYTQQDIAVAMKGVDVENLPLEEIVRQSLKKMVK